MMIDNFDIICTLTPAKKGPCDNADDLEGFLSMALAFQRAAAPQIASANIAIKPTAAAKLAFVASTAKAIAVGVANKEKGDVMAAHAVIAMHSHMIERALTARGYDHMKEALRISVPPRAFDDKSSDFAVKHGLEGYRLLIEQARSGVEYGHVTPPRP